MIDYNKEIVKALKTILPTYYEMKVTSDTPAPCISYMEITNVDAETGDTIGYSEIVYQIKISGNDIAVLQGYALEVDKKMRALGFSRVGGGDMYDRERVKIQKIMNYRAKALETY